MSKVLIAKQEAQKRLGLSSATMDRMRRARTGPAWAKIGARVLYDLDSVEQFIVERLAASAGSASTSAVA